MLAKRQARAAPDAQGAPDSRADQELQPGRVCRLPDGTEAVVGVRSDAGRCFLYHPLVWLRNQWVIDMPIAYEVSTSGVVLNGRGEPTAWRVEDIEDTGEVLTRTPRALTRPGRETLNPLF